MSILFPSQASAEETERKLWDHLAIMSDFKLDIDYPFPIVSAAQFETKPEPISYREENFRFRHYGRYIERMIATALTIEDPEARRDLEILIANHMKKLSLSINADGIDDARIFSDLAMLSHGAIRLSADECKLNEYQAPPQAAGKKKKKK